MLTLGSLVRAAVSVGLALALVGCAAGRPMQAPSGMPPSAIPATPTASPVAVSLAGIQLTGTALTLVGSDGSVLQQLSYSGDPVLAVAALSKRAGETPSVETLVATSCSSSQKRVSWGDGLSLTSVTGASATGSSFVVRSDSARTPGGVDVTTSSGFAVGDPIQSLIDATPDARVIGQDTAAQAGVEVFFDLDATDVGVVAISDPKTGLIRFLSAPVGVSQDC
ncbi:hypothetical protein F1C58_08865 [Glaciihabitans sp. INWT7]|uniref:hypothetical protein n=1 Tax=Glaciihabitans sp. INWT7 TaxID=2596912 RepID=UPI001629431F|nr:hypothetical protein [Glaciihabitans sp. INWT7]QNE46998.1 hypothetical protein F1C58_08865 [Glaciihabitans sp. INWT7]